MTSFPSYRQQTLETGLKFAGRYYRSIPEVDPALVKDTQRRRRDGFAQEFGLARGEHFPLLLLPPLISGKSFHRTFLQRKLSTGAFSNLQDIGRGFYQKNAEGFRLCIISNKKGCATGPVHIWKLVHGWVDCGSTLAKLNFYSPAYPTEPGRWSERSRQLGIFTESLRWSEWWHFTPAFRPGHIRSGIKHLQNRSNRYYGINCTYCIHLVVGLKKNNKNLTYNGVTLRQIEQSVKSEINFIKWKAPKRGFRRNRA